MKSTSGKSNLIARTLTAVIGMPALFSLIFFLPQYNFIGLSILIIVISFLGSVEMSKLIFNKIELTVVTAPIITAVTYLQCLYKTETDFFTIISIFFIIFIISREIGFGAFTDDFKLSIERTGKRLLLMFYPAYLLAFLIKIIALENINAYSILLFLLLVFGNDIFAYVFGMLLGRKPKRGYVVKVSPKKSYAGFIGGTISCVGLCILWFALFPNQLPSCSLGFKIILGLVVSTTANIGDLVESVFKRSAGVKDSGKIIPGRGGILDSTDSIMVAAPFFYILYTLII